MCAAVDWSSPRTGILKTCENWYFSSQFYPFNQLVYVLCRGKRNHGSNHPCLDKDCAGGSRSPIELSKLGPCTKSHSCTLAYTYSHTCVNRCTEAFITFLLEHCKCFSLAIKFHIDSSISHKVSFFLCLPLLTSPSVLARKVSSELQGRFHVRARKHCLLNERRFTPHSARLPVTRERTCDQG